MPDEAFSDWSKFCFTNLHLSESSLGIEFQVSRRKIKGKCEHIFISCILDFFDVFPSWISIHRQIKFYFPLGFSLSYPIPSSSPRDTIEVSFFLSFDNFYFLRNFFFPDFFQIIFKFRWWLINRYFRSTREPNLLTI